MSFESMGIALALVVITALWVFAPVLNQRLRGDGANAAAQQHERLTAQYERLLTVIRDLDEDYSTGKISLAAYEAEREQWIAQGMALLAELDAAAPSMDVRDVTDVDVGVDVVVMDVPAEKAALDHSLDAQIEQAVAARRREMAGEGRKAKAR